MTTAEGDAILSRIIRLWDELNTHKPGTPSYRRLMAAIRAETLAFGGGLTTVYTDTPKGSTDG